ncbi:MAG: tyrosine-type recombinase/integrase [Candidatus Falkowbacteria bacterium]|nr:tyrosine-type recombinase/integrase [Candidatus Falkowbacteria bacterium]
MAIRKIKDSWWVDIRFNRKRYRRKSPEDSKLGAKAYETMLHNKLLRSESIEPEPVKVPVRKEEEQGFDKFAWQWFEIYVKNNNKISEINGKRSTLKTHLVPFFSSTPLSSITGFQIEKYKSKKLKEGLSKKTVNNHLTVLNKCMRSAQEWFDMLRIPRISKMKTPPTKFSFFTNEESQQILKCAGDWHAMIMIALRTGLRLGELRGLMWEDINWETKVLSVKRSIFRNQIVPPKSNKDRHLPLTDELFSLLSDLRKKKGYVFTDPDSGNFLEENRPRRALIKIYEQAGLKPSGWHAFRHTFASHLTMAGAPLKAVQELLGHSNIQTTMRYAHLSPSTLKDAMNLLDHSGKENFGHQMGIRIPELSQNMTLISLKKPELVANVKQKTEPFDSVSDSGDGGS